MHGGIDIAIALNQCRGINALPARKARTRLRRIPFRIKGDGDRWTACFRADILLPLGKPRNDERRAARRADCAQALIGKSVLCEHIPRQTRQVGEHARHNVRRNFLRPNLKQQILTHAFPSFFSIG